MKIITAQELGRFYSLSNATDILLQGPRQCATTDLSFFQIKDQQH